MLIRSVDIIKYKTREDKLGEIRLNKCGTPMKLIEYRGMFDCDVEFQDGYNYVFEHAVYNNFLTGKVKNPYDKTVLGVGMLGNGKYKSSYDNIHTSTDYNIWKAIIQRCYIEENKYPAYYDISTMCDDWHNFQIFAKWYEENIYEVPDGGRMHLDKDILVPGNKQYSPETCIFIPQKINMIFSNMTRKDGLPNGIRYTDNGQKFMAMYNKNHLGCFDTLEDAYTAYAIKKEEAIKQRADEYKEHLPKKVYNALVNYKVKIEYDKNYQSNDKNF